MKIIANERLHVTQCPHQIVDNQILYFNGKKWLVRETCKNKKDAEKRFEAMCEDDKKVREKI